ncbi:MAG: fructose-6-phosphate aldolase [Bacteroidia bacterium]
MDCQVTYYVLRTLGTDEIPDYFQIRDENFILVEYLRVGRWEKSSKIPKDFLRQINEFIHFFPYGYVVEVKWDNEKKVIYLPHGTGHSL